MPSATNATRIIHNGDNVRYIGTFLIRYDYEPDNSAYASLYLQNPQHTFKLSKTRLKAMDIYEKLLKPKVVDLYKCSSTASIEECPGLNPMVVEVREIHHAINNARSTPVKLISPTKNTHIITVNKGRSEDRFQYIPSDNQASYIMAFPKNSFTPMDDTTDRIRLLLRFIGAPVSYTSQKVNAVLLLMLHLPHSEKFLVTHMKDVFKRDGENYRLLRSKLEIVKMNRSRWYYLMKAIHDNVQFDMNRLGGQRILNNLAKNVLLEGGFRMNPMGDMLFLFTMLQKERNLLIGGCFEGIMYSRSMEMRIRYFLSNTRPVEYQELYEVAFTRQGLERERR